MDNVEERFERIERNLDILTRLHLHRDREHEERAAEYEKRIAAMEEFSKRMTTFAAGVHDAIERLTRIAEAHERRISDLEEE